MFTLNTLLLKFAPSPKKTRKFEVFIVHCVYGIFTLFVISCNGRYIARTYVDDEEEFIRSDISFCWLMEAE